MTLLSEFYFILLSTYVYYVFFSILFEYYIKILKNIYFIKTKFTHVEPLILKSMS